jgi:hypothetical protein
VAVETWCLLNQIVPGTRMLSVLRFRPWQEQHQPCWRHACRRAIDP